MVVVVTCEKTEPGVLIPVMSPNGLGVMAIIAEARPEGWSDNPGLAKEIMSSSSSDKLLSSALESNGSSELDMSVADFEITTGLAGDFSSVAE
jgi:hypothetical protein